MYRIRIIGSALVLAAALLTSAAAGEPRTAAPGLVLPGSFVGDLPAASGAGVRYQLDLWPDQVFQLRRTWLDHADARDMLGRWHVDPARRALVLNGGESPAPQFEIHGNGQLRLLNQQGERIESPLPYELTRAEDFMPFEPALTLQGMFIYFADAARFTECHSARTWPVAMEADYLALERAYSAARELPQEPMLVSIDARIAERPRMEGEGTEPSVVVERFTALHPGEACGRAESTPTLRNTFWRVKRVRDLDVLDTGNRREPYLLLLADEPRFAATIGCNQMVGGAEISGDTLYLRTGPSTRMACPPPQDAHEDLFMQVLSEVASWHIDGHTLDLRDRAGTTVAQFEAAYLP